MRKRCGQPGRRRGVNLRRIIPRLNVQASLGGQPQSEPWDGDHGSSLEMIRGITRMAGVPSVEMYVPISGDSLAC